MTPDWSSIADRGDSQKNKQQEKDVDESHPAKPMF